MSRADHQPKTGPVVRPERSLEERQERCGTAIALIMATETGTTPITVRFEDGRVEEHRTIFEFNKGNIN